MAYYDPFHSYSNPSAPLPTHLLQALHRLATFSWDIQLLTSHFASHLHFPPSHSPYPKPTPRNLVHRRKPTARSTAWRLQKYLPSDLSALLPTPTSPVPPPNSTLPSTLPSRPLSAPPRFQYLQMQYSPELKPSASEHPSSPQSSAGPTPTCDVLTQALDSTNHAWNGHHLPVITSKTNADLLSPMAFNHTTDRPLHDSEQPSHRSLSSAGKNIGLAIGSQPRGQPMRPIASDHTREHDTRPTDSFKNPSNNSRPLTVGTCIGANSRCPSLDLNFMPSSQAEDPDSAQSTLTSLTTSTSTASTAVSIANGLSPLIDCMSDRASGSAPTKPLSPPAPIASHQTMDDCKVASPSPSNSSSAILQHTNSADCIDLHTSEPLKLLASELSDSISVSFHPMDPDPSYSHPTSSNLDCDLATLERIPSSVVSVHTATTSLLLPLADPDPSLMSQNTDTETNISTNITLSKKKKKLKKKKKSTAQLTSLEDINVCSQTPAMDEPCTLSSTDPSSNHPSLENNLNPTCQPDSIFFEEVLKLHPAFKLKEKSQEGYVLCKGIEEGEPEWHGLEELGFDWHGNVVSFY